MFKVIEKLIFTIIKVHFVAQRAWCYDKALACHTGSRGLNTDTAKDFFNSEKIISAPILLGTFAVRTFSLPMAWSNSLSQWLGVTLEIGDLLWER